MSEVSTMNTEKLNTIREMIADFDMETEIIATNLLGRIGKMFCNPYEVTQEAVEDTADKIIEREFSEFLEKSEEKPSPSREIESFISLEALADELGVSKPTVSTVKCKLGIPGTRVGRSLLLTSEDADRIRAYPFRRRGSKASEEICSESESKGERTGSDDGADFGDTEGDCSADGQPVDGIPTLVCASSEECGQEGLPEENPVQQKKLEEKLKPTKCKHHDIKIWAEDRKEYYQEENLSYPEVMDYIQLYGEQNVTVTAVR